MAYCQSNVLVPLTMSETNRCTVFNDTYLKEGSRDNMLFNQVIAVTQFFASTYLCLAVGVYELRNRKRSRTARVNQLSFLATVVSLMYSVKLIVELLGPALSVQGCNALNFFGAACFVLVDFLLYTILWARQLKFYADPLLRQSLNKCTRFFSHAVIFLIYVSLSALVFIFQLTYCMMSTKIGCLIVWDTNTIRSFVVQSVVTFIALCFICQMLLFLLITSPLVTIERTTCFFKLSWKSDQEIHVMIRRLAICTCACVLTTLLMCIFVLFDAFGVICSYWINWIGVDMLFNNLAVIVSFVDWKVRLFPFF